MMKPTQPPARLRRLARELIRDRRGNVLMLVAFSVIPVTLATGMSIDYGRAARLQTKLNAAADAAALAAVTAPMMKQDNTAAQNAALAMFKAQVSNLPGLIWNDNDLKVTISGNNAATTTRTALVSYSAKSTNAFAGIVGMASIAIGGSSTASATAAPNIDFYLALDTSSSMALPTTSAGFTTMDNAVECAFACHSNKIEAYVGTSIPSLILDNTKFAIIKGSFPSTGSGSNKKIIIDDKNSYIFDNKTATDSKCKLSSNNSKDICVYNSDGTYADSYWYAINQGVRLRVTDERIAARDLMTLAQSYALANSRTYRAALYTFDHSTNLNTIATLSSDLSAVGTAASKIDLVTVNDWAGNGRPPNGTSGTEYLFTSFKSIMDKMLNVLPAKSGKGSNDPGDTPQAFLFMVTDGMSDEDIGSGRTRKAMQQAQIDQCTKIKGQGIKIAILYTEYTKDSIKDDEPNQRGIAEAAIPNIAPALTKCASPGLMYTVKTDQSISDALQALFTQAVASARLTT
jgi:Flp pilus assembly protein TadG